MKLTFLGWERAIRTHRHTLTPLIRLRNGFTVGTSGNAIQWDGDGVTAHAKIENASLSGNFHLKFEMKQKELSNWLTAYSKANPEAALKIIASAQAEAMIALAQKSQVIDSPEK